MVTVKKLYDLNPHVEWLPFLNEVFNPAIRIHQHTQVNFIHSILIKVVNYFNQVAIPSHHVIRKMGALVKEMEVSHHHKDHARKNQKFLRLIFVTFFFVEPYIPCCHSLRLSFQNISSS